MQIIPDSMTVLELTLYALLATIKISSLEKQLRQGQSPPLQEGISTATDTTATPDQADMRSNSAS